MPQTQQLIGSPKGENWKVSGATLTSGAGAKGAYVEYFTAAANTRRSRQLVIEGFGGTAAIDFLLDIATGAAGSEVVLIPDVRVGAGTAHYNTYVVNIPASVRVAARVQGTNNTDTLKVALHISD